MRYYYMLLKEKVIKCFTVQLYFKNLKQGQSYNSLLLINFMSKFLFFYYDVAIFNGIFKLFILNI